MRLATQTVKGTWERPCAYCGMPANSVDHVVPRSLRAMLANWRSVDKWARVPDTVPACVQCNSTAGAQVFDSLAEKRRYIQSRYLSKHKRLLLAPVHSEDELADLGPELRSHVQERETQRLSLILRLLWPYDPANQIEAFALAAYRLGIGGDFTAAAIERLRLDILERAA